MHVSYATRNRSFSTNAPRTEVAKKFDCNPQINYKTEQQAVNNSKNQTSRAKYIEEEISLCVSEKH